MTVNMEQSRPVRHFYVAVGTQDQKLTTLMELLTALQLQAGQKLSTAIVCSCRDTLDDIISALQGNPVFSVCGLHSDLTDKEREFQVSRFQQQLAQQTDSAAQDTLPGRRGGTDSQLPTQSPSAAATALSSSPPVHHSSRIGSHTAQSATTGSSHSDPAQQSLVLVTTEVCLRAVPKDLAPLGVSLLIQYDLPTKKEQLNRRLAAVFGGGRERRGGRPAAVIDFVVGSSEVEAFRAVEKFTQSPILEMPVHVGEMFV